MIGCATSGVLASRVVARAGLPQSRPALVVTLFARHTLMCLSTTAGASRSHATASRSGSGMVPLPSTLCWLACFSARQTAPQHRPSQASPCAQLPGARQPVSSSTAARGAAWPFSGFRLAAGETPSACSRAPVPLMRFAAFGAHSLQSPIPT